MSYSPSDVANPPAVLALLGSFWSRVFSARGEVAAYLAGAGVLIDQTRQDAQELAACLRRDTVPLRHTELWARLTLRESERGVVMAELGNGSVLGDGSVLGVPTATPAASFPVHGLEPLILTERITNPLVALTVGTDYTFDDEQILFRSDPFANPDLAALPVFDAAGAAVDRQIDLWARRATVDRRYLDSQYAYAVGLTGPSTAAYRNLVLAVSDGLVSGATDLIVRRILAAVADAPIAAADGETMLTVTEDASGRRIVTDRAAYRIGAGASVLPSPGTMLAAGDPLTDTVTLALTNRGDCPTWLKALPIGPGILGEFPGGGEVIFADRDVAVNVELNINGYTKISWPLDGFSEHVAAFWSEVHRRGVAAGSTLAMRLDARQAPIDQPGAASLPATINPLRWLIENVLRQNCVIGRLLVNGFGPEALNTRYLEVLGKIVPPQQAVILLIEGQPADEPVTTIQVGEELGIFFPVGPIDEPVTTSDAGDTVMTGPAGGC